MSEPNQSYISSSPDIFTDDGGTETSFESGWDIYIYSSDKRVHRLSVLTMTPFWKQVTGILRFSQPEYSNFSDTFISIVPPIL